MINFTTNYTYHSLAKSVGERSPLMHRYELEGQFKTGTFLYGICGIAVGMIMTGMLIALAIKGPEPLATYCQGLKAGWITGGGIAASGFVLSAAMHVLQHRQKTVNLSEKRVHELLEGCEREIKDRHDYEADEMRANIKEIKESMLDVEQNAFLE